MTMTMSYPAVIRSDEEGFWAEFPDLPGCFGYAETLPKCVESAGNALETHITVMMENGMEIPEPSEPTDVDGTVIWIKREIEQDMPSARGMR